MLKVFHLVIADGITAIDDYAFGKVGVLKSIRLADSVETIGRAAFVNNFYITELYLGKGVKTIGADAFMEAQKLKILNLPEGVTSIGAECFSTNGLTTIILPASLQKIGDGWAVEFNGNNFVAYDNNLASPINSNTTLFTATFKVGNLATGTAIKVSYTNVAASDGTADANIGTVTYSATIAAPMSTDNTLKSLAVSNATISPAFSAGTTSYTAEVPFEVSKLNLTATANDNKAKVSVNSPNLTPNGTTKVTVTVTAENGSTKTYTISVKRAQDPNYTASGNNDLSGISVDGFLLSPVFSTGSTKYVIWLPYETESVTVSGTAADSKASVTVEGGSNLLAGQDNEIKVICTAESGTAKTYTVIAKRAAAHDGSVDEIPDASEPGTEPTEPSTEPSEPQETPNTEKRGGIAA